MSVGVVIG